MSGEAGSGWLPANAARAIYGQILVTSLVGALSEDSDIDAEYILVSVGGTMLVFWLAHVYAEAISRGLVAGRHVSWAEVRGLAAGEWPLVQAAFPTAIVLALGALGAFSTQTAVDHRDRGRRRGRSSPGGWRSAAPRVLVAASLFGAVISASFGLVVVGPQGAGSLTPFSFSTTLNRSPVA